MAPTSIDLQIFHNISSDQELQECYRDFLRKYSDNNELINEITSLLNNSELNFNFPDHLLRCFEMIFPSLLGDKATKFIIHILRDGIDEIDFIENEKLRYELHTFYLRYELIYKCAVQYVKNPLGLVGMIYLNSTLSFLRADTQKFTFSIKSINEMLYLALLLAETTIQEFKIDNCKELNNSLIIDLENAVIQLKNMSGVNNGCDK